jgi:hypothetical protein
MKKKYLLITLFLLSSITIFSQIDEDFEGAFPPAQWQIANGGSASNWEHNPTISGYGVGNHSAFFDNFTPVAPTWYVLRTPVLDLTGATTPELIFDVAYARVDVAHNDRLRLFFRLNSSGGWTVFETYTNATLVSAPDQATYFTPTSTQWRTITADLSAYIGEDNVQFAFEFNSDPDGGNVMYIDNVEIADSVLATPNENLTDFSIYPNPSEGKVTLNTTLENLDKNSVEIRNILGQEYANFSMNKNSNNSYQLDLDDFKSGMYFITITSDEKSITKKLYIK